MRNKSHLTRMLRGVVYACVFALAAACSRYSVLESNSASAAGPFDSSRIDGKVYYEAVDGEGHLTDAQVLNDPRRPTYDDGLWHASSVSPVTTINIGRDFQQQVSPTFLPNRVDAVFVGDGYTAKELAQYSADVKNNITAFLQQEPFRTYASYFQFHRIDTVSSVSGISEESPGVDKNTALGMSFNCSGIQRLLCANLDSVVKEAKNAPAMDIVFAMANSATYGGAGYRTPAIATFAARNKASFEIALHEFGHSFGGLSDEYDYKGATVPCVTYANVSADKEDQMKRKNLKWYRWLDLPQVGTFKGACYSSSFFRPTSDSKMRTLGKSYDVVNSEQLVMKIYTKVRAIQYATSPAQPIVTPTKISITPMQPVGHAMKIAWTVDGTVVKAFNDKATFDPWSLQLTKGPHTIGVTVVDPTTFVRDETIRARYLTDRLSWTVQVE